MVNAEKHGAQFPEFKSVLDASSHGDNSRKSAADDDSMAVEVRRMREGVKRWRRRVNVAVLGDNEIFGSKLVGLICFIHSRLSQPSF